MNREFKELVFKFAREASFESVSSIFLFGSVASGTADNRSDVDFLVVFNTFDNDFDTLEDTKKISELTIDLEKKHGRVVQVIFTNKIFKGMDENFIKHVLQEGILLYAKPPGINVQGFDLKPYVMFKCDLRPLDHKEKMGARRLLYGYSTKKRVNGRVYKNIQKGILEELNGLRIGADNLIILQNSSSEFENILKKQNVKYKSISIWLTNDEILKLTAS
jgi:predicted nucleotidyltransferase